MKKLAVIFLSGAICLGMVVSSLAMDYNEAPMLRTKVAAGELPPVEERLPESPKVVEVTEEVGQYGGTLRMVHSWVDSSPEMRMFNVEFLLESYPFPAFDADKILPGIIESWEVSEGKVFTFSLRKGMKWSDGVPLTTEDVRFVYEDFIGNETLTPVFPTWLMSGGEPAKLEVIDDYTFRLRFAEPYGLFSLMLQSHDKGGYNNLILPSHYMKQFHIEYTSLEEMEPLLEEEELHQGEWWVLFGQKNDADAWNVGADIGFPTLHPWMVVDRPSPGITIFERNPYYWKVDPDGNQLPYVDRIRMELVADPEMVTMKIVAGEVDFTCGAGGLLLSDLPLYKENEVEGYKTLLIPSTAIVSPVNYFPNLTHPDLVWRKVIQDPRFRRALSLGINRGELKETVFLGMGVPVQGTDLPGSPFMEEGFAEAYIDYDPVEANRLLDEMGLDKRDTADWRLRPDGKRLRLPIEFFEVNPNLVPVTELVVEYWRDLGIETTMKLVEIGLWFERQNANENIMSVWHLDLVRPGVPFFWFIPFYPGIGWAPLWRQWYRTDGKEGEEPSAEVKRLFELFDLVKRTASDEERIKAGKEILRSQAENIWTIGTVGQVPAPVIVAENLENVPGWSICTQWGLTLAEQVFFGPK